MIVDNDNSIHARAIEAHGIIGDQGTAALVADDGTMDFLCWPGFDKPTVFAALLDRDRGGAWEIAPVLDHPGRRQMYLPDTNVLLTIFSSPEGIGEITDFMPFPESDSGPRVIRRLRAVRGDVCFRLRCAPRLDYARAETRAKVDAQNSVVFYARSGNFNPLRLFSVVPLQIETGVGGDAAVARFVLHSGESADFTLLDASEALPDPAQTDRLFTACMTHWHAWTAQMSYVGRWREMVTRSALLLKLMTSRFHGSVIAAVTFGLPETLGGKRNWDYRATWIRDSSFTVYAFMRLGYSSEANAFMRWVAARAKGSGFDGSMQIMYALDGSAQSDEMELAHLRGYRGAAPVRIGNQAHDQVQLDIYGELLDAVYLANKYGHAIPHDGWLHLVQMVQYVKEHWRDSDHGIWEVRAEKRQWLHSRLMCWVALDRAMRLALKRSLPAPLGDWRETRDAIHASVWDDFWDSERGHFVAHKRSIAVDAGMLMMPLVRFVSATDPCWLATLDAIGRDLVTDPLVYRYRGPDGMEGGEGAFTACSFWYAECLARAGRLEEARLQFEKTLSYANPLGIYSEQIGLSGEHLGNFPQAFTHLALISAAFYLDRELSGAAGSQWRP